MNDFHQHPALSPSKKTFTLGITNTDNNDIEFWGTFLLLIDIYILSLVLITCESITAESVLNLQGFDNLQ